MTAIWPDYSLSDLFDDFPELLRADAAFRKELYAHFGLTMYAFSLLEQGMVNWLTYNQTRRSGKPTALQFDKFHDANFQKKLADLVRDYAEFEEADRSVLRSLEILSAEKNHLAHEFFRESAGDQTEETAVHRLLLYLAKIRKQLKEIEQYFARLTAQEISSDLLLTRHYEYLEETLDALDLEDEQADLQNRSY